MEQLAADGQLLEKVYGKQKTYVVNQVRSSYSSSHNRSSLWHSITHCNVSAPPVESLSLKFPSLMTVTNMVYDVIKSHCYALQCTRIDCEQVVAVSINN